MLSQGILRVLHVLLGITAPLPLRRPLFVQPMLCVLPALLLNSHVLLDNTVIKAQQQIALLERYLLLELESAQTVLQAPLAREESKPHVLPELTLTLGCPPVCPVLQATNAQLELLLPVELTRFPRLLPVRTARQVSIVFLESSKFVLKELIHLPSTRHPAQTAI